MNLSLARLTVLLSLAAATLVLPSIAEVDSVVHADGSPDVALAKSMATETLYGEDIPVTLTLTNTAGPDAYNVSFNDTLPAGVIYVAGSSSPEPLQLPQGDGTTVLVWSNVADSITGTSVELSYSMDVNEGIYDVPDAVTNSANGYVNSDPRFLPKFDGATGAAIGGTYTGNAAASATTELIAFRLLKAEPNTEDELLRGVHDNQTVYTLTVENNLINQTTNFSIVDYIPAQLEFLGCAPGVDNSTGGDEYTGSGPINPGNAPAITNTCVVPSSVTTVTSDPDGVGSLPSAVYTRVEWDSTSLASGLGSADLAPGGTFMIDYIAAIPMFENVQATLTDPTANLDNNTGALTTESERTAENYAMATGQYKDAITATDEAYEQVVIEDVSIHKSVDSPTFVQGDTPTWTLLIESSEYVTSTSTISVSDTLPSAVDFVGAIPAPSSGPFLNPDGTETYQWTLPAFTAPGGTATISIDTSVRDFYRLGDGTDGAPVASNDSYTNVTDLATVATVLTDAAGTTAAVSVIDESSASQSSNGPSILKEVGEVGPDPLTCGDGSGITFDPDFASSYRPGDRVCFRLSANFPSNLDTANPLVTDFLPAGFTYESFDFTTANTITEGDVAFAAVGPALLWTLPSDTDQGHLFQVVVQTIVSDPLQGTPGDLKENLMKFRYSNTAGTVFQLRDDAFAEWSEPLLDLNKGVIEVNGIAVTGAPVDGVTVRELDTVTYSLAASNSGSEPAFDVSIRDVLPAKISCSDVSSISSGGSCDAGNNWIQWNTSDNIDVLVGDTVFLTYDVVVPVGVSAGASLVNNAGVREYTGDTNTATPFTYVPSNNIDPTLTPNTDRADDPSVIVTPLPVIDKTQVTAVAEAGNAAADEATIGESVTYTVSLDLPAGTSYYNAAITDLVDAEKDLDVASLNATLDGSALPAGFALVGNDPANSWELTFPNTHSVPNGAPQILVVTFDAVVTDVASNTRASTTTNTARFGFEDIDGDSRDVSDSVTLTIVEPNIVLDKSHNDPDGVVSAGQTLTYTLDVRNAAGGSVSTAHETVVVDTVPPELIVNLASISGGGVYTPGATSSDPATITWTATTKNPGSSTSLTYDVVTTDPLLASGTLQNTAEARASSMTGVVPGERDSTSPNGNTVGDGYLDPAAATVTVPDLSVTKSGDPGTATVGETVTYTLDLTIPAGVIAYDVSVLDDLPPGLTYESLTSITCNDGVGSCSPNTATAIEDGDVVAFFFDDLTTASTATRVVTITYVTYVANLPAADDGSTLTNGAAVYWNSSDTITSPPTSPPIASSFDVASPVVSDDVDTTEPTLIIDKDVAGQVGDTDTRRAKPDDTLTYSLTITNTGSSAAYNATITDVVADTTWAFADTTAAAGVTNTDADPTGGLEWTIDGPIAPSASVTITYELVVPAGFDSGDEIAAGPEQTNMVDIPSYFGVDSTTRAANPMRTFRDYDNVVPDSVTIELDLASIGDDVWFDVNNDGIQQISEPVLADIDVTITYLGPDALLGGGDDEVTVTQTDAGGKYVVTELPGGMYLVDVDESDAQFISGLASSYDLDGGTITPNGVSAATLGEDEDKRDVDFGYTGTGSIGDTIWFDQDLDGSQGVGEAGITNIDVTVNWLGPNGVSGGGDDVVYSATTDAAGAYLVENLPAGNYTVVVDTAGLPAGYNNVTDPEGDDDNMSALTLGAGTNNLDQDFGYAGDGSIGDFVWLDQDNDGVQDAGEPGLGALTLELTVLGPDGTLGTADDSVFTTLTGASGSYLFDNLPPGDYQVKVVGGLPASVTNSYDPDTTSPGDSTSALTLADGEDNRAQDFGYYASSSLGDRVWWDRDNDGVQDAGEPGLNGIEVTATYLGPDGVLGGTDDEVFVTTTAGDGDYLHTDVPEGLYTVAVTSGVQPGFASTYDEDSGTSSPDQTTDLTLVGTHLTADFGYNGSGSIGDIVWFDTDVDGVLDLGEPGLEGVDIVLTWFGPDGVSGGSDDIAITTTTDASGNYLFDGLPAGEFRVDVTTSTLPNGMSAAYDKDGGTGSPDSTTPVTLTAGQTVSDVDFGYNGSGSIGDTVWLDRDGDGVFDADEYPLGGVDLSLVWASPAGPVTFAATTAADGTYLFPNLPPADYTVAVNTSTLPPGSLATFDADGGNNSTSVLTLGDGENNLVQDFGYNGSANIGDTIFLDLDGDGSLGPSEPGVPNQTVELTWVGPSGPVTFTTTTDANGNYLFDHLPDGNFSVNVINGIVNVAANTADPDGGPASTSDVTIVGGVDNPAQDFGYQGLNVIGDHVWWDQNANGAFDASEPVLENVEITVIWFGPNGIAGDGDDVTLPAAVTDPSGLYLVQNIPDGTYSVTVTNGLLPGRDTNTFDGDDLTVNPNGTSIVTDLGVGVPGGVSDLDQDFGYAGSGSIGDTVWLDLDGDGLFDTGEPGIVGAEVTLTWAGPDGILATADDVIYPTQTIGSDASYLFENLPAGPFQVDVTNPIAGLTVTADPDGGDDDTAQLVLSSGENNFDQDFGYVGSASVGDTIWLDVTANGSQEGNEPGLAGITVTVTSGGADQVVGTADDIVIVVDTDADGHYLVEGLPAGETTVVYDAADLIDGLVPNSDLDAGDLTTATVTLSNGDAVRKVDFGVVGTSTLSGVVYVDTDGNGKQAPGEPGIGGIEVHATYQGPNGPIVLTVITNPDGTWLIGSLPAGEYGTTVVTSQVPDGLVPSTPVDVDAMVPFGGTAATSNGFVPAASIGDRVWNDVDRNGIQDPGEPGTPGVNIELVDDLGNVIATAVTDTNGNYLFPDLVPGTYAVQIVPSSVPSGTVIVADPDGENDGVTLLTISAGEDIVTIDFGLSSIGELPRTGQTVMTMLMLAALLLGLGWLMVGVTRRRRTT